MAEGLNHFNLQDAQTIQGGKYAVCNYVVGNPTIGYTFPTQLMSLVGTAPAQKLVGGVSLHGAVAIISSYYYAYLHFTAWSRKHMFCFAVLSGSVGIVHREFAEYYVVRNNEKGRCFYRLLPRTNQNLDLDGSVRLPPKLRRSSQQRFLLPNIMPRPRLSLLIL